LFAGPKTRKASHGWRDGQRKALKIRPKWPGEEETKVGLDKKRTKPSHTKTRKRSILSFQQNNWGIQTLP